MLCTRVERGRVNMKVDINKSYTIRIYRDDKHQPIVKNLKFIVKSNMVKGRYKNEMGKTVHREWWANDGRHPQYYSLDLVEIHIPDNVIKCKMPAAWLQKQVRDEECKNANT